MKTERTNELVAMVVRETGWTLEYIRHLDIKVLTTLATEISYQKAQDDYRQAFNTALIVCALCSTKQRRLQPQDIIGQPPQRRQIRKGATDIWKIAEQQGIKIPKERT